MATSSPEPSVVLNYARPFVTGQDLRLLGEERYADLSRSIRKRAWLLMTGFTVAALFFLLNSITRGVQYLEAAESGHLIALGMWLLAALIALIYGGRYFGRLRRAARFFQSRSEEAPTPAGS